MDWQLLAIGTTLIGLILIAIWFVGTRFVPSAKPTDQKDFYESRVVALANSRRIMFRIYTGLLDDKVLDLGFSNALHVTTVKDIDKLKTYTPVNLEQWDGGQHVFGAASNTLFDIYQQWHTHLPYVMFVEVVDADSGQPLGSNQWPPRVWNLLND